MSLIKDPIPVHALHQVVHLLVARRVLEIGVLKFLLALFAEGKEVEFGFALDLIVLELGLGAELLLAQLEHLHLVVLVEPVRMVCELLGQ